MPERYDYYTHGKVSPYHQYFGRLGIPRKITRGELYRLEASGYQTYIAPLGTPRTEVLVLAAIARGASPTSYRIEKIREHGDDVH